MTALDTSTTCPVTVARNSWADMKDARKSRQQTVEPRFRFIRPPTSSEGGTAKVTNLMRSELYAGERAVSRPTRISHSPDLIVLRDVFRFSVTLAKSRCMLFHQMLAAYCPPHTA